MFYYSLLCFSVLLDFEIWCVLLCLLFSGCFIIFCFGCYLWYLLVLGILAYLVFLRRFVGVVDFSYFSKLVML